MRIAKKE